MRLRRGLFVIALVLGCGKQVKPQSPVDHPLSVVEAARSRPLPDIARARFNIKVRSEMLDIAGSTGGGLVVARPGRGRLDVFGPLGSSLITATSDGQALCVLLPKDHRQLVAADAEKVVRQATGGAAGLDDVLAALMGDLPFDDAEIQTMKLQEDGTVAVVLDGPRETSIEAVLDPATATPRSLLALDADGVLMLGATFGEFVAVDEQGRLLPTDVALEVPAVELSIEVRYKSWDVLEEAPDVFHPAVPDDFTVEQVEDVVKEFATGISERSGRR